MHAVEQALAALGEEGEEPEIGELRLLLSADRAAALEAMGRAAEATRALGRALTWAEQGAPAHSPRRHLAAWQCHWDP
jgi:hypothetical protein